MFRLTALRYAIVWFFMWMYALLTFQYPRASFAWMSLVWNATVALTGYMPPRPRS
jgi:hypothetical protein